MQSSQNSPEIEFHMRTFRVIEMWICIINQQKGYAPTALYLNFMQFISLYIYESWLLWNLTLKLYAMRLSIKCHYVQQFKFFIFFYLVQCQRNAIISTHVFRPLRWPFSHYCVTKLSLLATPSIYDLRRNCLSVLISDDRILT